MEGDSRRDLLISQRELGTAIMLTINAVTIETLPEEFGLLLIRLAMAEVLRDALERDAGETEPEDL
jgi:hypothetical protein